MRWYLPEKHLVLWIELRRRLRGWHWHLLVLLDILILGGIMLVSFSAMPAVNDARAWSAWGRSTWWTLMLGQGGALLLFGPLLTVGAITAEREAKMLEALWLSSLSTWSLVYGKYLAALVILSLLLLAGMPVVALVFVFGGVSLWELLLGYLLMLFVGAFAAACGLLASCQCQRAGIAVLWAYLDLLLLALVPFLGSLGGCLLIFLPIWPIALVEMAIQKLHWERNLAYPSTANASDDPAGGQ